MNFVDIIYDDYINLNKLSYFSKSIPTIRKISNVRVKTNIVILKNNSDWQILLEIGISNINLEGDNYKVFDKILRKCSEVTRKDIKVALQKMKKIIPNLKFDKMFGKIYTDQVKSFEQICLNEFGSSFIECNECCVCNETTTTKTNCYHFLCIECLSHIRSNQCPMCREENIYIQDSDNESDYESESDDSET
jgi:hypothetical protein